MARDALVTQWWDWHGILNAGAAQGDGEVTVEMWHQANGAGWALYRLPDHFKAAMAFWHLSDRAFRLWMKVLDAKRERKHHD